MGGWPWFSQDFIIVGLTNENIAFATRKQIQFLSAEKKQISLSTFVKKIGRYFNIFMRK